MHPGRELVTHNSAEAESAEHSSDSGSVCYCTATDGLRSVELTLYFNVGNTGILTASFKVLF